ncbi:unnamed protein product [Rotaria sordida]|uniref:F-box domain-containing protein n=1 Tax=Rotaria sordida TaxID=392033 RepID=A0A813ZHC3_9BILA|nr:unnamed protein product [Rotaria sordida]CAF1048750.1 unnamed protein product [Rotaria sordida]CAF1207075.1 unnamed protein product [Rotaria sordida]CAF4072108.1 unnamed protein product [Rotaria sordida]
MAVLTKFQNNGKCLEQLPNEIFIEIFQYLNGTDIIYGFSQLNTRFQCLLIKWVNKFDFKSITKDKFYYVIQHHDMHRWRSLRLCDNDKAPGQTRLFCQLFPLAENVSQLESLSILNMKPTFATNVLSQLVSFNNLISLTITTICGEDIQLFELPSLKRLVVTGCKHNDWIKKFHSLKILEYTINYMCHYNCILTLPETLQQLKLFYNETRDGKDLRISLCKMSQLNKLALYDQGYYSPLPDGRKWEELIKLSLPLLKTFQFCFHFVCYPNESYDTNQAMASFSTSFYTEEKCWFVRCDSNYLYAAEGVIYTLPFAFSQMRIDIKSYDMSVSTLVTNNIDTTKYDSYDRIHTLLFSTTCEIPHRNFLISNIVRLVLKDDLPRSWYSLLKNLRYLEFQQYVCMSTNDFADFLEYAVQLQSLTLLTPALIQLTDSFKNKIVCDQLSKRIQSLTISDCLSDSNSYQALTNPDLLSNIVSIFRKTCKHLSLNLVSFPKTTRPIFRNMQQLHSLHIYYPTWRDKSYNTAITWFQQCVYDIDASDFIYTPDDANFYVWIKN